MSLGKPALFIAQILLLHALVAYHALAGDTADVESPAQPKSTKNIAEVNEKAQSFKANESREERARTVARDVQKPAGPDPLLPGALKLSSIYEDQNQMLADLNNAWSAETTLDPWLNARASYYLKRGKVPMGAIVMLDVRTSNVLVIADRFQQDQ